MVKIRARKSTSRMSWMMVTTRKLSPLFLKRHSRYERTELQSVVRGQSQRRHEKGGDSARFSRRLRRENLKVAAMGRRVAMRCSRTE
jgi:hypothetical protein